MSFDGIELLQIFITKISFIVFMVACFFLLSYFLVEEGYELSKSTNHLLSVILTLEWIRIPTWSVFFFYFNYLTDDVQCKMLSELMMLFLTHHFDEPSYFFEQVEKSMTCNLMLKITITGKYSYFLSTTFEVSRFGT